MTGVFEAPLVSSGMTAINVEVKRLITLNYNRMKQLDDVPLVLEHDLRKPTLVNTSELKNTHQLTHLLVVVREKSSQFEYTFVLESS